MRRFYPANISYLLFIVLLNTLFSYVPDWHLFGHPFSVADLVVGFIYVMRDMAQKEAGHGVWLAMIGGCALSWLLANEEVAVASIAAFVAGETIDWAIYTFSKRPLSQRILWSSVISSPVDSAVNLYFLMELNWVGLLLMTATKVLGAVVLWATWSLKLKRVSVVPAVSVKKDFGL